MAAFDWYEATVLADVSTVRQALAAMAEGVLEFESLTKAPHGYGGGWRVLDDGHHYGTIWAGGSHAHPHVLFTGGDAVRGSHLLRSEFAGAHLPTRVDAAEDYAEPGAYDRIQPIALVVAKERKVKIDTRGDHLVTMKGRTLMLGSAKSAVRLRLYDKAEEQRAKFRNDPQRLAEVPEHLARLEVQTRPQTRDARLKAAQMEPVEFFGSAAFTREVMKQVAGLELEPCNLGKVWRQSDDERAYTAVLAQYGGLFKRMAEVQGWHALGLQIRDDLAAREAYKLPGSGRRR